MDLLKKKLVRSTAAQIKRLVDHMSANPGFAAGDFTGPLGAKRLDAEWLNLKNLLMEHGPDKTVEQWKQTWKDLKKKARNENAAASRARSQTGNSVVVPAVSETSVKVLGTIGHESSLGIGPADTPIGVNVEPHNVACEVEVVCDTEPATTPEASASTSSLAPPTATQARPQKSRLRRRNLNTHASEFSSLQNENNQILKELAQHIKEKNELLREQNSILRERNRIIKRKERKFN